MATSTQGTWILDHPRRNMFYTKAKWVTPKCPFSRTTSDSIATAGSTLLLMSPLKWELTSTPTASRLILRLELRAIKLASCNHSYSRETTTSIVGKQIHSNWSLASSVVSPGSFGTFSSWFSASTKLSNMTLLSSAVSTQQYQETMQTNHLTTKTMRKRTLSSEWPPERSTSTV